MNLKSLYPAIFILMLLSSRVTMAQVAIPDPNFKSFLQTKYPSVIRGDGTLDTIISKTINTAFKCYARNITNLSGIQYFKNIITLEVKYNPGLQSLPNIDALTKIKTLGLDSNALTSLPNLSKLASLQILSVHHNQLTSIPSLTALAATLKIIFVNNNQLTTIPDLTALVNLEQFMCSYNPITSLPSFSAQTKLTVFIVGHTQITLLPNLSNSLLLTELSASNCQLSTLPDFSAYTALSTVILENNYLSFQYLLQFASHSLSYFSANPQALGTAYNRSVPERGTTTFDLGFDQNIGTNTYTWYKGGIFYKTTNTNKLTIDTVAFTDAGVYTCVVSNTSTAMAGVQLNVAPITLAVTQCLTANPIKYELLNASCQYPIKVNFDESSITGGTKPFSYTISNTKDQILANSSVFLLNNEGTYQLKVKDARGCKLTFTETLFIPRDADCDPVFLPNGDGVADTYFINETGLAKIYNKNGVLIKEINAPNSWDGTNTNNAEAPTGLYVIMINDKHIKVTLLR